MPGKPGSSLRILAILQHNEDGSQEITSTFLGRQLQIAPISALHLLQRLSKYGQVTSENKRLYSDSGRLDLSGSSIMIPYRLKRWYITEEGRIRLERKGGHDAYCTLCGDGEGPDPLEQALQGLTEAQIRDNILVCPHCNKPSRIRKGKETPQ